MKDIIRIMRVDFITCCNLSGGRNPFLILGCCFALVLALDLFITPIAGYLAMLLVVVFYIPLQQSDDKSQLNKLYGILPVQRKNIARGRFLYMFLIGFAFEIILVFFGWLAVHLNLNRLISFQNAEMMQIAADSYNPNTFLTYGIIIGMFTVICLGFMYVEMMGQIFGREKEMKIMLITLGVITVIGMTLGILADKDIIPPMEHDLTDLSFRQSIIISVIVNAVNFGLSVLFGEITARVVSKREL